LQEASPEMMETLKKLRTKITIGVVGGSDLEKQKEQLGSNSPSHPTRFKMCLSHENISEPFPAELFTSPLDSPILESI
jgi:phosphomannomutase